MQCVSLQCVSFNADLFSAKKSWGLQVGHWQTEKQEQQPPGFAVSLGGSDIHLRRSSFICANSTAVTVRSWFSSVRLTSVGWKPIPSSTCLPSGKLPSLKLTWHLKMDGWNTIVSFWGPAYFIFRGENVSFRECNLAGWNIPIFNRKCIDSIRVHFLLPWLVYRSVGYGLPRR